MNILKRTLNAMVALSLLLSPVGIYLFFADIYEDGLFLPIVSLFIILTINYILFGKATLWNKFN